MKSMGVASVVRRYIDILIIIVTFPYSTCISSFFGSSIPTSVLCSLTLVVHVRSEGYCSCPVCLCVCVCVCVSLSSSGSAVTI